MTRGMAERLEGARLSVAGQRTACQLGVELRQIRLLAGTADNLDPRPVLGDPLAVEEQAKHVAGFAAGHRLERKLKLMLTPVRLPATRAHHRQPRFLDLPEAEPGGVVEIVVGRLVEHAERGVDRLLRRPAGDGTHGGQARTRMLISDTLGQARLGISDTIRPLVQHLHGGGANTSVLRLKQLGE